MALKSWSHKVRALLALQHEVGWLVAARLMMFLPLLTGVSLVICGSAGNELSAAIDTGAGSNGYWIFGS